MTNNTEENEELKKDLLYYKYLRREIKREDIITHQRITWSMTLQGFLVSAMALLLGLSWDMMEFSKDVDVVTIYAASPDFEIKELLDGVVNLRRMALFAVGILGMSVGILSLIGVWASRSAINEVISTWEDMNMRKKSIIDQEIVPRTYGRWPLHINGVFYGISIPLTFCVGWAFYLSAYIWVIGWPIPM